MGYLDDKYAILREQADAAMKNAEANAALAQGRINTEMPAQAGLMGAQGAFYRAHAATLPNLNAAMGQYYQGMAAQQQAQAGLTGVNTQVAQQDLQTQGNDDIIGLIGQMVPGFQSAMQRANSPLGSPGSTLPNGSQRSVLDNGSYPDNSSSAGSASMGGWNGGATSNNGVIQVQGHARGTSKVKGKGKPNKDTVPAMLAPGEAVLNQGAADHVGRNLIDVLNAIGAHKMTMQGNPPPGPGGMPVAVPGPAGGPPQGP
jgi:hypothetical protein